MGVFKFSKVDFLFTCAGLVFLVLDIGLDVYAAVTFYQEKAYVSLGILLLFLVGSSVLVQTFSWLWYSYENFQRETTVENILSEGQLKLLHVLQLGIYFRHAGVVEVSLQSLFTEFSQPEDVAVFLSHDLSMLRLIETFSESAPQLVLMLTLILRRGEFDPVTVLKALGSASTIALSVTMYHRSLRSFLPDKEKQKVASSVVYFLWNLLLISSRLAALALFASVLPCFIFTHFVCSWMLLFMFVWWSKTDFMDTTCGEWLYRATVGLIWYFDWFNVVKGKTRYRTLLYHMYILADISLLCGLWCWKMSIGQSSFDIPQPYTIITAVSVVVVYIFGLLLKIIYYKLGHPKLGKERLKGDTAEESQTGQGPSRDRPGIIGDEMDSVHPVAMDIEDGQETDVADRSMASQPAPDVKRCNKRMRKLAENFYY